MSVGSWLSGRQPRPPSDVIQMLPAPDESRPLVPSLATSGVELLAQATERTGKDRDSAFTLLAADALLTYACEAAAQTSDPRGALREVLGLIGEAF